jgi:hypothetical protein
MGVVTKGAENGLHFLKLLRHVVSYLKCGCKKGCRRQCKCVEAALPYLSLSLWMYVTVNKCYSSIFGGFKHTGEVYIF